MFLSVCLATQNPRLEFGCLLCAFFLLIHHPNGPKGGTYLLYGDEAGNIVILQFHDPLASLFATNSKDFVSPLEDIQMVLFSVSTVV